jgi:hypothetical protein
VREIYLASSKGHRFVFVATYYFTKWSEAVPLKNMTHREVISFDQEHIIHRLGILQTLTTDQGASFMSHQFKEFATSLKIRVLNSSPYYAQANGHAESSNKIMIKLIKKKVENCPRRWHEVLSEAPWAHRVLRHGATKVTPFELVYGQEAVLPVEINLQTCRVLKQEALCPECPECIIRKLERTFQTGELVWKTILPLGSRDQKFGKWSPSWKGPFKVIGIVPGGAYFVETREKAQDY